MISILRFVCFYGCSIDMAILVVKFSKEYTKLIDLWPKINIIHGNFMSKIRHQFRKKSVLKIKVVEICQQQYILKCAPKLMIICSLLCLLKKYINFDSWQKINLIFYPFLENVTTHIAVMFNQSFIVPCDLTKYLKRTKRPTIYAV